MNVFTSNDGKEGVKTSELNEYVIAGGIKEIIKKYRPPWWYFHSFFGNIKSHLMAPYYDQKFMPFERVYLDHEHKGKIVLDVRPKLT